jgi:hypothetical protein
MNKHISKLIAFSVLALPVAALAQDFDEVKVTVPFSFKVGTVTMPAGQYTIIEANEGGLIRIAGDKSGTMLITVPGRQMGNQTGALEFEQTKGGAVLKEVRMSNRPANVLPTNER